MYEIIFTKKSKGQFLKLEKSIQQRIGAILERIKIRPETFIEKLVEDSGYELRVGDYRLISDIDKNKLIILIIKLGHRRNIYKK